MVEPKQASADADPCESLTTVCPAPVFTEEGLTRHWRTVFLAALAETSNVTAAATAAGVHLSRPYKVRRTEPEFARAWYAALLEGYENLEMEVLHRLRFGEARDGEIKFDNAGALRLLGLHRETVTRERAMRENEDLGVVRAAINAKLEQLRRQVMARDPEATGTDAQDG